MFTNLVLICSYGIVALTAFQAVLGNWSGIASIGNFAAAIFAIPYLLIRAWKLRRDLRGNGLARVRWLAIGAFPFIFACFWVVSYAMAKKANAPPEGFIAACYGGNFSRNLSGATPKLYLRIHATPEQWPLLAERFRAFGAVHDLEYFDTSANEPGLLMLNVHLCSAKGVWLSADKRLWGEKPADPHPDEMPITLYSYGHEYDWQSLSSDFQRYMNDWPGPKEFKLPEGESIRLL